MALVLSKEGATRGQVRKKALDVISRRTHYGPLRCCATTHGGQSSLHRGCCFECLARSVNEHLEMFATRKKETSVCKMS